MAQVHSELVDDAGGDADLQGDAPDLYANVQAVLQGKVSTLRGVEEALERGASPEYWRGLQSPLRCAVDAGHTRLLSLLLRYRAHPDMRDEKGVSALHVAAFDSKTECIRILLNGQADPNIRDRFGQTPLFFAPTRLCCELLLAGRADVAVRNHKKQLALHFAAYNGLGQSAVALARRMGGSEEKVEDHKGLSPMHYATHSKTKTAMNLLQHHRADEVIQSLQDGALPKTNTEPTIKEMIMLQSQSWQNSLHPGEDTDAEPTHPRLEAEQGMGTSEMRYTEATDGTAPCFPGDAFESQGEAAAIDMSLGGALLAQPQASDHFVEVGDSYAVPECQASISESTVAAMGECETDHAGGHGLSSEDESEVWCDHEDAYIQRFEEHGLAPLEEVSEEPPSPVSESAASQRSVVELQPKYRLEKLVEELASASPQRVVPTVDVSDWRGCVVWTVLLEKKSDDDKFGMQVGNGKLEFESRFAMDTEASSDDAFLPGPETLLVRRIPEGGLLERWNRRHPYADVRPQDRVCAINGTVTVQNMNTELRSRRRIKMQVIRYPERFLIQLHKDFESDRLGFRFAQPAKIDEGAAKNVRIVKLLETGLVAEHNKHQVMMGNWHYVVMPNMFIEAVNGIEDDAEAIVEELKSAQTFVMTLRRAENLPPTPQQVKAGLQVVGKFLALNRMLQRRANGEEPRSDDDSPAPGQSSTQQVIGKAIGKFKSTHKEGGAHLAGDGEAPPEFDGTHDAAAVADSSHDGGTLGAECHAEQLADHEQQLDADAGALRENAPGVIAPGVVEAAAAGDVGGDGAVR